MSNLAHRNILDFVAGRIPVAAIDYAAWRSMKSWAKRDLEKQVAKIKRHQSAGQFSLARRTAKVALQRVGCRFAVAAKVIQKTYPNRRTDTEEIRLAKHVKRMSALKAGLPQIGRFRRAASAQLRPKLKADGTFRPLLNFRWIDKAQQMLLAKIYLPFADFHPAQYQHQRISGLGGTAAVREALRATLDTADDTDVFLHFDINRFFDCVGVAWLKRKLWLPDDVICRHVHTVDMVITHYGNDNVHTVSNGAKNENGRLGLPQGSALSPVLADLLIADILRTVAVPENYQLFVWSDNIGVVVPQREAAALVELLRSAFADHEAGPFDLKVSMHPVTQGFKFLGTWFSREEGRGVASILHEVADAWAGKIHMRLDNAQSLEEIDEIKHRAVGTLSQWKWWSGVTEYEESVMQSINDHRDLLIGQMSNQS